MIAKLKPEDEELLALGLRAALGGAGALLIAGGVALILVEMGAVAPAAPAPTVEASQPPVLGLTPTAEPPTATATPEFSPTPTELFPPTATPAPLPLDVKWMTPAAGATPVAVGYQAEKAAFDGVRIARSMAYNVETVLLNDGQGVTFALDAPVSGHYTLYIRQSNDNPRGQTETLKTQIDGQDTGEIVTVNTGTSSGEGWNAFAVLTVGTFVFEQGAHSVTLTASGGDGYGVEIDALIVAQTGW